MQPVDIAVECSGIRAEDRDHHSLQIGLGSLTRPPRDAAQRGFCADSDVRGLANGALAAAGIDLIGRRIDLARHGLRFGIDDRRGRGGRSRDRRRFGFWRAGAGGKPVLVSALKGEGIEELLRRMDAEMPTDPVVTLSIRLPLAEGRTLALIHALGRVLHSEIDDSHMRLDAEVPASIAKRLRLKDYAVEETFPRTLS